MRQSGPTALQSTHASEDLTDTNGGTKKQLHPASGPEQHPYIGGTTPWVPTVTRAADSLPSAPLVAMQKIFAPTLRSAGVAGANVTIGVEGGT
jgi:hypothetical protein